MFQDIQYHVVKFLLLIQHRHMSGVRNRVKPLERRFNMEEELFRQGIGRLLVLFAMNIKYRRLILGAQSRKIKFFH